MNRAQKRQQGAIEKRRRKLGANRKAYDAYRERAELWARGAVLTLRHLGDELDGDWEFGAHVPRVKHEDIAAFATHAPLRWHVTAVLVLKYHDGSHDIRENEAECGQLAKVHELTDLRDRLMSELKARANTRFAWDEYFVLRVMK